MEQPHTEQAVSHTDGQQNTGNHKQPGTEQAGGADRFGGTRKGAENVEPASGSTDSREEAVETGTDVDRVSGLAEPNTSTKTVGNPHERHPERDEFGRL